MAVSGDGRRIATADSKDGTVRVWDFASEKPVHTLVADARPAQAEVIVILADSQAVRVPRS